MLNGRLLFFQQFLRHPAQIGSIIPSSRFLERRVVAAARIATARLVVELGPGTGGTTRALLAAMPRDAKLLTIELNPQFHALLQGIDDARHIAHLGSARDLPQILNTYGLGAPDAVVSGIPFSTMEGETARKILGAIKSTLADDGRFLAYQVSNRVALLGEPFFGRSRSVLELLNVPPMRLFLWERTGR